jgi:hypothetical protein
MQVPVPERTLKQQVSPLEHGMPGHRPAGGDTSGFMPPLFDGDVASGVLSDALAGEDEDPQPAPNAINSEAETRIIVLVMTA